MKFLQNWIIFLEKKSSCQQLGKILNINCKLHIFSKKMINFFEGKHFLTCEQNKSKMETFAEVSQLF